MLFKAISTQEDNISLKLLYNSKIEGENAEKLKQAYLGKNDIIVLVKTKKDKRFGGYAHEVFFSRSFEHSDNKAFLFNLDKMKIYKSNGGPNSIWNYEGNSIDFGGGTDLRVFHEFFHKQNYTDQISTLDYNYDEEFALNGEKFFEVKYLEIYQVIFD